MREIAKRVRRGIKEPLQGALAWAAVRGLDTRPRSIDEVRTLDPARIVVSRTDRIGDLLVSSVMIAALHRRWPHARLVMIGGPHNRAALEGLPFVEAGPEFRRDPRSWVELRAWLKEQHFDLAMSLQAEAVAGAMIAAWSEAPVRATTHATKVAAAFNFIFGLSDRHHITRFCRAAGMLGVPCAAERPVYVVPTAARAAMRPLWQEWRAHGQPVVGLQVPNRTSRRHAARAWPEERLASLARALAERRRTVVLFGHGPERVEAQRIKSTLPWVQIAPAGPLAEAAALLEHVDVFVSGYTGMYHLADAVGAATVLIGSAHYAEYWRALGERHRHVLGESAAHIGTDGVQAAVEDLLGIAARRA